MHNFHPGPGKTPDTRLIARAIKERWPIKPEHREAIVNRMVRIAIDPSSSNREAVSAAKAIITAESQNQADEHHEAGSTVHHEHTVMTVVEDGDWYNNNAHAADDLAAQSLEAPAGSPAIPGPIQGSGVRPTVGQDSDRPDGDG